MPVEEVTQVVKQSRDSLMAFLEDQGTKEICNGLSQGFSLTEVRDVENEGVIVPAVSQTVASLYWMYLAMEGHTPAEAIAVDCIAESFGRMSVRG